MISIKKKSQNKLGRPSQKKNIQPPVRGIVKEPQSNQFEEQKDNECILAELMIQNPLYLKCITNTIKQLDKNNIIHFCLTPSTLFIYYQDNRNSNNCFMQISGKFLLSYYFKAQTNGLIKFELPVGHLANTFNFYNRSSLRTELRIFGPSNPMLRIDSIRTEKKVVQNITNTINVILQPSIDEMKKVRDFAEQTPELQHVEQDLQKASLIMNNKNYFNNCFFFNYRDLKVYSFQMQNQEIRKFITEVQKDSQHIFIARHLVQDKDKQVLKLITIKANIPGSSSVKKIEHYPNQILRYKNYGKSLDVEETYVIGSDILKQIVSTNPQSHVQFTLLANRQIILKIKNNISKFKFQINNVESFM